MRPIKFEECNHSYGEGQEEYYAIPGLRFPGEKGQFIIKWKLSWRERWAILRHGIIWQQIWTFNRELQPQFHSTNQEDHFTTAKQNKRQRWWERLFRKATKQDDPD